MSKIRLSEAGVHLFDRVSGLNVLLDEVEVPAAQVSRAPRYLSVALTNACELRCAYCYAPKRAAALAGLCGFVSGGAAPSSPPRRAELAAQTAESTSRAFPSTPPGPGLPPGL